MRRTRLTLMLVTTLVAVLAMAATRVSRAADETEKPAPAPGSAPASAPAAESAPTPAAAPAAEAPKAPASPAAESEKEPKKFTYPEPSVSSRAWKFDFTSDAPKAIAIRQADGSYRWYWYVTYKVTNNSGTERVFVPDISIVADSGQPITAGKDIPVGVYTAIKETTGNRLLESPILIVGRLLQGEDNARESVAIWPAESAVVNIDQLKVFVAGLSGELAVTENAKTQEKVVLRRTLMFTYDLPGANVPIEKQPVVLKAKEWVMR